jgi:hypothetical protein
VTDPGLQTFAPVGVRDGLVTLGPAALRVRTALESVFTGWAARVDADQVQLPPLIRVGDLARFDFFANFPHLALAAAAVSTDPDADLPTRGVPADSRLTSTQLDGADYVLPSAACYNAYLALAGARLEAPVKLTTVAQCFRREREYHGLRRLHGFTMREIVAVGAPDTVKAHLAEHKELIADFAAHLGVTLTTEVATDPFFDPDGSRAVMQRLFPTKEEFVSDDGIAIASVNYHRNFFGERADIHLDGEPAHTACVAFGIERWLHVLADRFDQDWDAAETAIRSYPGADAEPTAPGAAR